ncbi:MAG: electron transport complex subunit E [Succinivibrio sp.]
MSDNKLDTVEGTPNPCTCKKEGLLSLILKGLWSNNPGLCQLLGLCPLLAVTTSVCSAIGLGVATLVVMILSSLLISLIRKLVFREIRIPVYVLLIATLVSAVKLNVECYFPDLYSQLGIYLSLIVTNCIIMGRAEAFAGRNGPLKAVIDAIGQGLGFFLVLFTVGAIREVIGSGTLFAGASALFGDFGSALECSIIAEDYTLMVAILPPGGFFVLAFLIAFKNFKSNFRKARFENSLKIKSIRN